jgi:hypothetical protein
MSVGIGTVAAQFFSWEYLFRIFGIVYLQCRMEYLILDTCGGVKFCSSTVHVRYGGSFYRIYGGSLDIRDVGDYWIRNVMLFGLE